MMNHVAAHGNVRDMHRSHQTLTQLNIAHCNPVTL